MIYKFIKHWLSITLGIYLYALFFHVDTSIEYSFIPHYYQLSFVWIFILGFILSLILTIWLDSLEFLNHHYLCVFLFLGIITCIWVLYFNCKHEIQLLGMLWFCCLIIPLLKYHRLNKALSLYQQKLNKK